MDRLIDPRAVVRERREKLKPNSRYTLYASPTIKEDKRYSLNYSCSVIVRAGSI
ncbi:hypothetical protein GCM10025794_36280 [Massilia kyonggiensis]